MSNEVATKVAATGVGLGLSADELALLKGKQHKSDFNREDLGTPYVQIVQSGSGYAKRSDEAYIEGAQEGDIIDTLTLRLRKKAAFIPAKYQVEYTEWEPDDGNRRGKLVKRWGSDRSLYDASEWYEHQGKKVEWGPRTSADGNNVVPSANYYGLLVDEDGSSIECVLTLTGKQSKKARRFNDLINALEIPDGEGGLIEAPCYARLYGLTTTPESEGDYSWMGWKIEPGPLTLKVPGGRSLFEKASRYRDRVEAGQVKTMETAAATEAQRSDETTSSEQRQENRAARRASALKKNDDGSDPIPF